MPYELIESIDVGLDRVPSPWALRLGLSVPWSDRCAGRFWTGGQRLFLDVRDRRRAVVLRLRPGGPYDVLAIEPPQPEELAAALRQRIS